MAIIAITQLDSENARSWRDKSYAFSLGRETDLCEIQSTSRREDRAYYTTASKEPDIGAGHGRRTETQRQQRRQRRASIQLSYGGFCTACAFPRWLWAWFTKVSLFLENRTQAHNCSHHRRLAIHNVDYRSSVFASLPSRSSSRLAARACLQDILKAWYSMYLHC